LETTNMLVFSDLLYGLAITTILNGRPA